VGIFPNVLVPDGCGTGSGQVGQILLALTSIVILGSESCRTQDHLLLFHDFGPSGKLLLVLASTVILGSKSSGDHDHILLGHDCESHLVLFI
jgi:hypothetical protein